MADKWPECKCPCPEDAHVRTKSPYHMPNHWGNTSPWKMEAFIWMKCTGTVITSSSHYPCRCMFETKAMITGLACEVCGTLVTVEPPAWVGELPENMRGGQANNLIACGYADGNLDHEPIDLLALIGEHDGV